MANYGFSAKEARAFLERELNRTASSTSFYWESDELEDLLDLVVDAVAKLIEANNASIAHAWQSRGLKDLQIPPM